MRIDAGDQILLSVRYRLLRLHDFDIVGDACNKAVSRLRQGLIRQVYVALCDYNLVSRRGQVENGGAYFLVNLPPEIR